MQQEISCYHNGDDNRNDYVLVYSGADLHGGEGDDILEVLAPSYETYYNGGTGADTFKCSPSPADIVQDHNPGEGDTVSADCETVKGSTPPEPIQTDLTLNTITNVPSGKDLTVPGKLIYLDLTAKIFASTKGREYLKRFEELNCSENDILQERSSLISLLEGGDIQKTC